MSKKKETKEKEKKKKNGFKIPKSVQDSIPYISVYKNGVIETEEGVFTKTYKIEDVNFKVAAQQEQEKIFLAYGDLLNSFNSDIGIEITINNRTMDKKKFYDNVLLKMKGDKYDEYREEYNSMLKEKAKEGNNNIYTERYITLSIREEDIEMANIKFRSLEGEFNSVIKRITGQDAKALTLEERLDILYNVYNLSEEEQTILRSVKDRYGHDIEAFNVSSMASMGLTTKDIIAPSSLRFNKDHFVSGNTYGQVLYLHGIPSYLSTDVLSDITNTPCNMLTSVFFRSLPQEKALKIIKNRMTNINADVIEMQKKASKSGYSADILPPDLATAKTQIERVYQDITQRNQKLFLVTLVVAHFANSLEELEKNSKSIQMSASKRMCQLKNLNYQQEGGFATSLPLAINNVKVQKTLTTEAACVFIPFEAEDLNQLNGMYYGINPITKNLILYNRSNGKNCNGVILGQPGSGKSFSAKREIVNVLLNTDDEVYILDPEAEYMPLAEILGGQVVRLAAGSNVFINPMDMDINYADDDDPITLKADFVCALCETLIGGRFGISNLQKSIIDRCVRKLYERYMEHMQSLKEEGITCDMSMSPTLSDLYDELTRQPEPEAQNIALSLELYTVGSLDTFSHKTNVELNNRFVVFNIKDLGSNMQEMGLKITLNYVWNKMIENRKKGKRTWFYIDEFYLMTKTESSATFLKEIWKRARKWKGVPTGITQNIEDILMSEQARSIVSNSEFVMMLSQAQLDRNELAHIFNLSESEVDYITEKGHGVGLLYTGKTTIPFMDKFPTNTKLFQAMTTTDADKKPKEEKRMTFNKKENEKSKEIDKNEEEKQETTINDKQKQDINYDSVIDNNETQIKFNKPETSFENSTVENEGQIEYQTDIFPSFNLPKSNNNDDDFDDFSDIF